MTDRTGHRLLSLVLGAALLAIWLLAASRVSTVQVHHTPVGVLATGGNAGAAPACTRSDTRVAEGRQKITPEAGDAVTGSWYVPVTETFLVTGDRLPAGPTGHTVTLLLQGRAPPRR